ncbi:enoyl-CoA hydratase/isomerase family protein [Williamsia deligens]|uniref:Enoyl-CoA hydratase/isomerase family protein n=1 Tax=Williamsia deligens TaxID=321325 RepID=A0ABW3G5E9_9NOCA|nr:enoyl-CoA hydratase/isomerase family protein [Williamsia deligens]MCP2193731.1 Enoyl-CoA hydratase/carnithine racemase [Williamsia deligens]
MTPTLDMRDSVAVITLGDDENRFSPEALDLLDTHLDSARDQAGALVTVGTGKFWSNGLDLDWLMGHGDQLEWYVGRVHHLFERLLTFPMPTVAAVNGHAFGAGAMAAIAHDFRIMRSDRGYYCFPEVDIDIPFTPGMAALIQSKTVPTTAVDAMTTGRRYSATEAVDAGLVDATEPLDTLLDAAIARVTPLLGKNPATVAAIKSTMYAGPIAALRDRTGRPSVSSPS